MLLFLGWIWNMFLIRNLFPFLCIFVVESTCFQCKTLEFNYTISAPGCQPKIIQNNFCYGQCGSSYFSTGELDDKPTFLCSVCRPSVVKKIHIYLKCQTFNGYQYKPLVTNYISRCSCKRTICTSWWRTCEVYV